MALTFHLDFDPLQADHRRAADWLAAQPDPTAAIVRLIGIANEGEQHMRQWEELATLLANEVHALRAQLAGLPPEAQPKPDKHEDPESARRLDSMFA